jgi:toxin-antitoxin system PIN domain toxin
VKIIDSNILIYSVNLAAPEHGACRAWLQDAVTGDEEIGFNWIAIIGFLRISTHPRLLSQPLSVPEAAGEVDKWLALPVVRLVEPQAGHWTMVKELLLAAGRGGNLTTDAHLAALAISHDATLVSCDNDFARFRRLKWENPLAVP